MTASDEGDKFTLRSDAIDGRSGSAVAGAETMEAKRQHLEVTADVCGGKPRIAGTRITVKDVVLMHLKSGYPLAQIAGTYNLSLGALHEAMAYYYDHQADFDRLIGEDEAFVEALERKNPSLLQQKLRSMRVA